MVALEPMLGWARKPSKAVMVVAWEAYFCGLTLAPTSSANVPCQARAAKSRPLAMVPRRPALEMRALPVMPKKPWPSAEGAQEGSMVSPYLPVDTDSAADWLRMRSMVLGSP